MSNRIQGGHCLGFNPKNNAEKSRCPIFAQGPLYQYFKETGFFLKQVLNNNIIVSCQILKLILIDFESTIIVYCTLGRARLLPHKK